MSSKIPESRKEDFLYYYNTGLNDYEIARKMGISDSTIYRWRREFELPPLYTKVLSRNNATYISQEQKEILCGTLLGDSSIQYYPKHNWRAPIFKCDHGPKQKEYAELLYNNLRSIGVTIKEYRRIDKRRNKEQVSFTVKSKANPALFEFYNELYNNGKKQITENFLKNFTIKSLAYLYMDDGYAQSKTAFICTDSFSKKDIKLLRDKIKSDFNLDFHITKRNKNYRLRLLRTDFQKFRELMFPYIIDSLKYKLRVVS